MYTDCAFISTYLASVLASKFNAICNTAHFWYHLFEFIMDRPRLEVQKAAQEYFDGILQTNNITITEHTKVVVAHLRRGDYVGKKDIHGLLTRDYYQEGVKMILSRVAKQDPQAATEGPVHRMNGSKIIE